MAGLIKMRRADGATADVHPDMVEDYRKGGFEPVDAVEADNPLDHDGDGTSGGSVKGFHSTAAKGARKRKAK